MLQRAWCGVSIISLFIHSFVYLINQSTFGGGLTTRYRIERERKKRKEEGREGKEREEKGRKGRQVKERREE